MSWSDYWVWYVATLILGILEVLAPGFVLLGFAISAGIVGTIFLIDGGLGGYLAGSLPITLVVFAALALLAWIAMRRIFSNPRGQVKIWETDINDNE